MRRRAPAGDHEKVIKVPRCFIVGATQTSRKAVDYALAEKL